ncbi:hypothetical protein ACB098_10G130900 [Castanea mollissima]
MHQVQHFGTKFIFIAAFLQTVSLQTLHRDQMLFVTYFYCDIFFHKHFWSKKLNTERERERERYSLQVKFNVSDEVSYRSEWFQCFRQNSQNGYESTDPIIPIYDKW